MVKDKISQGCVGRKGYIHIKVCGVTRISKLWVHYIIQNIYSGCFFLYMEIYNEMLSSEVHFVEANVVLFLHIHTEDMLCRRCFKHWINAKFVNGYIILNCELKWFWFNLAAKSKWYICSQYNVKKCWEGGTLSFYRLPSEISRRYFVLFTSSPLHCSKKDWKNAHKGSHTCLDLGQIGVVRWGQYLGNE